MARSSAPSWPAVRAASSGGAYLHALPTYLVYICINIGYNVLTYLLLRAGSATLMFVATKAVLPLSMVGWPNPALIAQSRRQNDLI